MEITESFMIYSQITSFIQLSEVIFVDDSTFLNHSGNSSKHIYLLWH